MPSIFLQGVGTSYTVEDDIIRLATDVAPDFRYLQSAKLVTPSTDVQHYNEPRFPASIEGRFSINKRILAYEGHVNHPELWVAFPQLTFALFMQLGKLGEIPGAPNVDEKMLAAMQKGGARLGGIEEARFLADLDPKEFYGNVTITTFRPEVKAGEYIDAYFHAQFSAWNKGDKRPRFTSQKLQHAAHWPLR